MSASSVREQLEQPKADRDPTGRFAIGNPGGPGNPYARRVAELRKAMLAAVSEEDIAQIIGAMVQKAKEGNVQAAKVVLSYTIGKPEAVKDPDRADVEEWELNKDTAAMYETMAQVVGAPPADLPLQNARLFRPLIGSIIQQNIGELFQAKEEATRSANGKTKRSSGQGNKARGKQPTTNGDSHSVGKATCMGGGEDAMNAMERAREELWEEMLRQRGYFDRAGNGQQTEKNGAGAS